MPISEKNITVGILIPTYNRLDYLKMTLQSAMEQTHRKIKIIVVDDASTDGTANYIAHIQDPRVSYVLNEVNLGLASSVDKGIRMLPMDAEWCTVLCDDDLLDKDSIRSLVHTAVSQSAKTVVHSHRKFINWTGEEIGESIRAPAEESAMDYLIARVQTVRQTYLTGVLFHRQAFEKIGGYPKFTTGISADDAFIFALSLKDRLVYEKNAITRIRYHRAAESRLGAQIPKIVTTMREFQEYCEQASRESRLADSREVELCRKVSHQYAVLINSSYWLQNLHLLLERKERNFLDTVSDLCKIVEENRYDFSLRVRFDALGFRVLGILPETYMVYRAFWLLSSPSRSARWHLHVMNKRAKVYEQ